MLGGDAFRVKLNAVNGKAVMLNRHNCTFISLRGNGKTIRLGFWVNNKGMITRNRIGRGDIFE